MTRRSKRKASAKSTKKSSVSDEVGDTVAEEITESQSSGGNAESSETSIPVESTEDKNRAVTDDAKKSNDEIVEEDVSLQSDHVKPDNDKQGICSEDKITSDKADEEKIKAVETEMDQSDAPKEGADQVDEPIKEDNDIAPEKEADRGDALKEEKFVSSEKETDHVDKPMKEGDNNVVSDKEADQVDAIKETEAVDDHQNTPDMVEISGKENVHVNTSEKDSDNVGENETKQPDQKSVEENDQSPSSKMNQSEDDAKPVIVAISSPNDEKDEVIMTKSKDALQQSEVEQIDLTTEVDAQPFVPKNKIHQSQSPEAQDNDNDSVEMMDVSEDERKPSEEINVTASKEEKEPVVIELNANDDLTEDDISAKHTTHSPLNRSPESYKVVDEIDLTKSDDEAMDVTKKEAKEYEEKYIIPDYDDPNLIDIEIDPEQDSGLKAEESKEFLRYWHPVQENPQEFTSWTYLLQFVEQDGKLPLARRAFNKFFTRYPLCYGYWKKFSELERRAGNILRAQKVLERGVRAIPLSVDLWVHVIDFYANHYNRPDAGIAKTRTIYERAISAAGQEFRSEKLWNKYIKWENENKNWQAVFAIYDRAIRALTQHYSILFSDMKMFVSKRPPQEILSEEEYKKHLKDIRKEQTDEKQQAQESNEEKKDVEEDGENKKSEGTDNVSSVVEDDDKPPSENEIKAIRGLIIKARKVFYDETEQMVTKIWAYEEGIKRPYFHVKQLERTQLKNWREYLDVEIAKANHDRIVLLFERCLIACALYEDFWLKYTKYMAKQDAKVTSKIFERACTIHLPKKPNIHIQWAAHEELQGNISKATDILQNLDSVLPGMAMIRMRRVALERRAGYMITAEELLRTYVASAAKDKEEIFYTRKLAWFLLKILNKKDEAKKILKDLIPKYKSEVKLYNDLVEMEFQCAGSTYPADEKEEGHAMESFNLALSSDRLTEEQKFVFSQRKLEFLEDFGRDVKLLQKAYDEHQKLLRIHKKRTQIDLTSDETPSKKAKVESSSIAVVGTSQLANGASYTAAAATTPTYTAQQSAYVSGDPNAYYQQQQNYWAYAKPNDTQAQQQYNYSHQWSQYYGTHQ